MPPPVAPPPSDVHAVALYPSYALVVLLYLIMPVAGVGLCPVVPTGTLMLLVLVTDNAPPTVRSSPLAPV